MEFAETSLDPPLLRLPLNQHLMHLLLNLYNITVEKVYYIIMM